MVHDVLLLHPPSIYDFRRRPTEAVRVAILLGRNLSVKEIAEALGKTENAIRCLKREITHNLLKWPLSRYCPNCFQPAMLGKVCQACGAERDEQASLTLSFEGQSEPTSILRRDCGLGSSSTEVNSLISWMRRNGGYGQREGLRMADYESLARVGDDGLTRKVLGDVVSLGGIRDGDFVVSEQAGRMARKLVKAAQMKRAEITRSYIHNSLVLPVLKAMVEAYLTRIRLDPSVVAELQAADDSTLLHADGGFRKRGETE